MRLSELVKKELIFINNTYPTTDAFYSDYAAFLKTCGIVEDKENTKRLFIKRENLHATAIGKGAATPHIFSPEFKDFYFTIALLKEGMDFKAPDDELVYVVFIIMSDELQVSRHLKTLSRIARMVNSTEVVSQLKQATTPEEILKIITENEKLLNN